MSVCILSLSNSVDLYVYFFEIKKSHETFSWFFAILTCKCPWHYSMHSLAFWHQCFTCKCASCTVACISDIFTSNNSPSPLSFLRFWLENMLRATAASNLSPSVFAEDLCTGCFAKPTFRASRSKAHLPLPLDISISLTSLKDYLLQFPMRGTFDLISFFIITIILAPAR